MPDRPEPGTAADPARAVTASAAPTASAVQDEAAAVAALGAAPGAVAGGNAPAGAGAVQAGAAQAEAAQAEAAQAGLADPAAPARPTRRAQMRLTALLMGGALFGKLLGFLREIEMARLLGASFVADSFRGALTATLLPIAPLAGDMVPSVMIPLHRQWHADGVAPAYFTSLMTVFTAISLTITVLVWIFASQWVDIVVGGFGPEAHAVTVDFVRVMGLAMPSSTLSNCMSCIEISVGRSRITTIRASMSNVGIMIGIVVMAYTGHAIAIAWGYVIAFNLVVLYGGTKLVQEGEVAFGAVRLPIVRAAFAQFFRRMRPLLVQPFTDQGNILLERYLGSTFSVGTLASLDYARTLTETALYLVSQPIGYVMLAQPPGEAHTMRGRVSAVSRPLLGLAMPAALFLCVFAPDIVSIVFQRGRFQEHAVLLTSGALRGISVGLWASTLGWILLRMINATGRNGAAARVIIAASAGNSLVNLSLWLFASVGVIGLGLGEATRGLILLFGTAFVLGCLDLILGLIARLLPCLLLLLGGFLLTRASLDAPLLRLVLGGVLLLVGVGVTMLPDLRNVLRKLQNRRRARLGAAL